MNNLLHDIVIFTVPSNLSKFPSTHGQIRPAHWL